jgi:cyclopropane fatty-acyl-phospholipid synthase-like methyltransferase
MHHSLSYDPTKEHPMSTSTTTWGTRAHDWAAVEEQQLPTYAEAIERSGLQPGDRVLDIGCGTGVFLQAAAEHGAQPAGVDASPELLAIARDRAPSADLQQSDMEQLPYEDDRFDVVTGFNAFFFASDMVAALVEAGRVAKAGAPVVIQVWGAPERCSISAMKHALAQFFPQVVDAPSLAEPGTLEALATAAGLTPGEAYATTWAYAFADEDALLRAMLAPGQAVAAIEHAGEDAVRTAVLESLARTRRSDGSYRLENVFHTLIARA